jgi:hypothetical protein
VKILGTVSAKDTSADRGQEPHLTFAVGSLVFLVFEALVALQGVLAHRDSMLTIAEMHARGISQGLPFLWHLGMWGDALIVCPLAAFITGRYWSRWRAPDLQSAALIAIASSWALSWLFTFGTTPEAHVLDQHLTLTGWVHAVYMAAAFTVFLQFLFFTEQVSKFTLRVTSALLVLHVFLGTHMMLGVVQLVRPLDWYPAHPLASIPGWIMLGSLAIALAWLSFATAPMHACLNRLGGRVRAVAIDLWCYTGGLDPRTDEGFLRFLDVLCGLLVATRFLNLVYAEGIDGADTLTIGLTVLVGAKYYLSRMSVTQELEIGRTLYPAEPDRMPRELQMNDRAEIARRVFSFMLLYLALLWTTQYILVASAFLAVIAVIDYGKRYWINAQVLETFKDRRYKPLPTDSNAAAIDARRKIVIKYLNLPHLRKEAVNAIGSMLAFAIALYGYFAPAETRVAASIILIATQTANEVVTQWWRVTRYYRLKELAESPLSSVL